MLARSPETQMPVAKLFSVTLAWNQNDPGEGTYATSVWANDVDDAKKQVAEEMVDERQIEFDTDGERHARIAELAKGPAEVCLVADRISSDLGELFADELFPDNVRRAINVDVLRFVLMANRSILVETPPQEHVEYEPEEDAPSPAP